MVIRPVGKDETTYWPLSFVTALPRELRSVVHHNHGRDGNRRACLIDDGTHDRSALRLTKQIVPQSTRSDKRADDLIIVAPRRQ